MMPLIWGAALVCVMLSSACAQRWSYEAQPGLLFVGAFILFYDSNAPLSYQTWTPRDVPAHVAPAGEVTGSSCQHGLSIPLIFSPTDRASVSGALGDGGVERALRHIYEQHPELAGVYDVKVDVHQTAILTIYRRECTVVVARGVVPRIAPDPGT